MQMYTPSLNWGRAIPEALLWAGKAWVITAVVTVIALVLLARFTQWGRQFWRVTGGYFTGRDSVLVWAWLGVLLFLVLISVRIQVLLSYQSNDLYSSLQVAVEGNAAGNAAVRQSGMDGFQTAIVVLLLIVVVYVVFAVLLDVYLTQRFIIRWRAWLTERLTSDWLDGEAFYRGRFLDDPIDNPDQRIQVDIDSFTAGTGLGPNSPTYGTLNTLLFGAINALVSVVAFTPILWNLSGPLTILGITVNHALFWIALLYVVVTTVIAFWIGRPLIRFSFRNQLTNAAFRYGLVRVRDAAESISFYDGASTERSILRQRFSAVISNYRGFVVRNLAFLGWNQSIGQLINPLPLLIQASRLFKGQITFGDVTQSAAAFTNLQSSLSFFRAVYDSFANYRATIIRLDGLVDANERARSLPRVHVEHSDDGALELRDLVVRNPDGRELVQDVDLRLEPGESLVITGPSGCGRTTMLRSIAALWPYSTGTVLRPDGRGDGMFLSQVSYLPLGDLRAVLCYPDPEPAITDEELMAALHDVALGHLTHRLSETQDWSKTLSPGEQQRIAFARVLLQRPKVIFLDESTAALDEGNEYMLYRLIRTRLPDAIVVSVTHREAIKQHHKHHLHLVGDGTWEFNRDNETVVV